MEALTKSIPRIPEVVYICGTTNIKTPQQVLSADLRDHVGGLLDWRKAANSSTEDIGLPRAALKFRRKIPHGSATSRREGRVGDRLVIIRQWLLGRERTGRGFDSAEIPVSEIVVSHGAAVLWMENNRAYSGPS